MLRTRIITAAVLIPAVLAALFLLPPLWWACVVLGVIALGAVEWARLVGMSSTARNAFVVAVVAIGIVVIYASARGWQDAIVIAVCGVASLFWIFVAPPWVVNRWPTQGKATMAIVGLVVLLGAWTAIVHLQARSPWLVLAAMAVVWVADTAAYFAGRAFGRHKLAPQVSPGKTWEGVYGALAAVAIYAWILSRYAVDANMFQTPLAVLAGIVFVVGLASISVVGDLFESLLKRNANVKDSGNLLPGHGGVLDRIDALLAAMPAAALLAHACLR